MQPVYYYTSNIINFKQGTVVFLLDENLPKKQPNQSLVGHVVRFTTNQYNEVLVTVDWADGSRTSVAPFLLSLHS